MNKNADQKILDLYCQYIAQELSGAKEKIAIKKLLHRINSILQEQTDFLDKAPVLKDDLDRLIGSLQRGSNNIDLTVESKNILSLESLIVFYQKFQRLKFPLSEAIQLSKPDSLSLALDRVSLLNMNFDSIPKSHNNKWRKVNIEGNSALPWTSKPTWRSTECRETKKLWCHYGNKISLGTIANGKSLLAAIEGFNKIGYCGRNRWRLPSKGELEGLQSMGGLKQFGLAVNGYVWIGNGDNFGRAEIYSMLDGTKKITSVNMKYPALIVSN